MSVLFACTTEEKATPTPAGVSPAVPAAAPVELVMKAAEALGAPYPAPAEEDNGEVGGGTPVTVHMKDPGGSGQYGFDPAQLNFKVGELVTFTITSESEFHTFTSEALNLDRAADARQSLSFNYTFDQAGSFEFICVPHQALGMTGRITVQ